jgi:hypothetical protein
MIGLLSRIPNAQKATSYDEGWINAQEGRQQYRVGEQNCDPPDKIMISRLGSEVKHSHLADCAALRDRSMVKAAPACGLTEGVFFGSRLRLESRA